MEQIITRYIIDINPNKYGHLIFDKKTQHHKMKKEKPLQQKVLGKLGRHVHNNEVRFLLNCTHENYLNTS